MAPAIETARLKLIPLQLEDAKQTQPLFGTWDVVKYLNGNVPWPYPAGAAHAYYRDVAIPAIERGDEWHWTLRLKEATNQIIGGVALHRHETNNRGFWMGAAWRRRGLMLEAVEAATDYWFESLGFQELRAPKASENIASVRISEKTGMRLLARQDQSFVSGILPAEVWVITRDEWLRRKRSGRQSPS
ncbi:MAG: GNAT family N-acetyltransferase [Janthinobacterium lividum]